MESIGSKLKGPLVWSRVLQYKILTSIIMVLHPIWWYWICKLNPGFPLIIVRFMLIETVSLSSCENNGIKNLLVFFSDVTYQAYSTEKWTGELRINYYRATFSTEKVTFESSGLFWWMILDFVFSEEQSCVCLPWGVILFNLLLLCSVLIFHYTL